VENYEKMLLPDQVQKHNIRQWH